MLTDLNWLSPGAIFPPPPEKERIERYRINEQLFLGNHPKVWQADFNEIARRLRKRSFDVRTVFNYQQLLSRKIADFVCGEPPKIETEQDTDALIKLLERQRWNVRLYEAFIDVSRYGNAVLKLVGKDLTAVSPACWFPVVSPTDLKAVTHHVIAYPSAFDASYVPRELYAEIHTPGAVEVRRYGYDAEKGEIGGLIEAGVDGTGLSDFAVQVLTNVTHSGSVFGVDDYAVINSIVAQIMWRLHCVDTVLDRHSEPSISGPRSALKYDERSGLYYFEAGNYFARDSKDDPDLQYITWNGNLENSFKEIEMLLEQLYILSEMGQAFMEGGGGGNATSGTALRLRMVSPRIKAARLVGLNNATVKQIIVLLAQLSGISIDYDSLTIHWSDGLPADEVEQIGAFVTATGGKPIMSQYAALKRMGLSDAEVEAELEQMREEQASLSPSALGLVGPPETAASAGSGGAGED